MLTINFTPFLNVLLKWFELSTNCYMVPSVTFPRRNLTRDAHIARKINIIVQHKCIFAQGSYIFLLFVLLFHISLCFAVLTRQK